MNSAPAPLDRTGLTAALGAYVIWGLMPLYLLLVRSVPAFEFVGWRIIWTLPLCLLIALLRKQWPELRAAFAHRRTLGWLALSATLIAVNWVVYVWAIQNGQVYAASLGYYINPLVNVLLGTMLLGERLTRRQWIAVALAAIGVSLLAAGALTTLWISLTLALSFGSYGLIRKQVAVGAVPGLTIESTLLLVPSFGVALYYAQTEGSSFAVSPELSLAIMAGGAFTAFPLLLFAIAARKLPYSTLGFIQFLAPSIVFILGLTVFGEELKPAQAACFACIWAAAAVFAWDMIARSRKPAAS
ncbi:EamA family transporter RarD [Qipengyuania flava]|jgi:chloramphenicol-sensitive protein RarD|uniref:EamA family transporter RarD n=1 Tax=Qipengyuania flava TaxID=192812 RepID=UPI00141ADBE7|nr:EamA family transporter RarD [Qipengyuania flava]NIJ61332.1 chloramphenicol-sensitive protein RarD [Qipengyuania flava]